jgi:glycosyltransferase involved in cell wall biosynthesis
LALFAQGQHPKPENMPYLTWSESVARLKEILLRDDPLAGDGKVDARQLFVDVSELSQRDAKTGCQRVTRSVLLELLINPPAGLRVEPVYATVEKIGYRYARAFTARLMGRKAEGEDHLIDFAPGDIFFGLDLQPDVVCAQQDFLLRLKRHGVDVRFLVHDILPVAMPHCFAPEAEPSFRRWLETLARFDGVIAVSKATADALQAWYRDNLPALDPKFRFDWSHHGADIENSAPTYGLPEDAGDVLTEIGKRPAFLLVGTIEPRKGYAQTLAAFNALWTAGVDVNLVIVGKNGWAMDAFIEKLRAHPESGRRLFWLQGISDEYLEKIYAAASCLIAASEGEGFGLPLIEAARHKLPILARDIAVFREVAGEHASYFRGMEPDHLFGAIREWLALFAQGQHRKSEGMPYLTWSESVARIKEILLRDDPLAGDGKVDARQLPQPPLEFAGA